MKLLLCFLSGFLTFLLCCVTVHKHIPNYFSAVKPMTPHEGKVRPHLLADIRHYEEWPSNGWELFGLTESEIKSAYCVHPKLLDPAQYVHTTGGGKLIVDWGAESSTFILSFSNQEVSSVTEEEQEVFPEHRRWRKQTLTSRDQALQEALEAADRQVENDFTAELNLGFLWHAYRQRAKILFALGRSDAAEKDIQAAEKVETEILKNPKKIEKDGRPLI